MEAFEFELTEKLAANGDRAAMMKIAEHYFYGMNKQKLTTEEFQKMHGYYFYLADQGDAHAMMVMGSLYYEGLGLEQDYTEARKWYEKAAEAGDIWALNYLGYCYYYGREIAVDYEKAWLYFSRSSLLGNHCGMYKIGDMYQKGLWVSQSGERALYWYRKAIALIDASVPEYPNIAARIGHCVLHGIGCKADTLEALHWLHRAEEGCYTFLFKGDAYAHLSLPEIKGDIEIAIRTLEAAAVELKPKVQYS